jgi:hypothetical protein
MGRVAQSRMVVAVQLPDYDSVRGLNPDSILQPESFYPRSWWQVRGARSAAVLICTSRVWQHVRFCRYRFKFQSNLVWDSIKSISNFCFQF